MATGRFERTKAHTEIGATRQVFSRDEIASFDGKYAFLSNFYPASMTYDGMTAPTLEHIYQACKAKTPEGRAAVLVAGVCSDEAQGRNGGEQ